MEFKEWKKLHGYIVEILRENESETPDDIADLILENIGEQYKIERTLKPAAISSTALAKS